MLAHRATQTREGQPTAPSGTQRPAGAEGPPAGLMPPPRLKGRLGLYDAEHQGKLELIRDLRQQGFRLDAIKEMLDKTPQGAWTEYSLISELFSTTFFTVEAPKRKGLDEMAAHWDTRATPEQKARLSKNGLYRPLAEGDEVEILSPALERIGIQLAELNVPLDTVLDLQDELIRHTRAIAKAYVEQLFLNLVEDVAGGHGTEASKAGEPLAVAGQLRALFERLRPLAIGSISAAFPVVLQQEFDRSVAKRLKRPVGR
ncbi:MerR family transcriptional regulator, partial [Aquabacterium sp.]|uniref:MerR family transcriptional regulator n=1 Tax=Aquabacterium sp. TaxID=1872578 RepID=UPI0025B8E1BB